MNERQFYALCFSIILFLDLFLCPIYVLIHNIKNKNKDFFNASRNDIFFIFIDPVPLFFLSAFFIFFFYRSIMYGISCGVNSFVLFFMSICPTILVYENFLKKYKYDGILTTLFFILLMIVTVVCSFPFLSKRCVI